MKKSRPLLRRIRSFTRRLTKRGVLVLSALALILLTGIVLAIVLPVSAAKRSRAAAAAAAGDTVVFAGAADTVEITPPPTPPPTPTPVPTPTPTPDPTLKKGMDSAEVQLLQERLMELGYLDIDETTQHFGPATEAAVELFQRQIAFNLAQADSTEVFQVDGIAGLRTLELIYAGDAPKYVVKEGMEGEDITQMQQQLVDLGYMKAVTGYYGEKTITAIQDFQNRNGLSPDGLAGEKTVSLLYSPEARESASKAKQARSKASVSKMIEVAKSKLGCKYVLGATGAERFDCSGLVYYCLKQAGSNRNRYNAAGYSRVTDWEKISDIDNLKKGDLIFFYDNGFTKVGHVGIVVSSSGVMIDASSSNGKVVRRSYLTSYWRKHFVCGRRPW